MHILNLLKEDEIDISGTKDSWVPGPDGKKRFVLNKLEDIEIKYILKDI